MDTYTGENVLTKKGAWRSFTNNSVALMGFSRAYIGFFVLAQSAIGAVLVLKGLPSWEVVLIGTLACLAGSYSLIAYNDLLDIPIDKMRFDHKLREIEGFDIGSAFERHPVARGLISFKLALAWILAMAAVSMLAISYLNPSLIWVLPAIAIFVTAYSILSTKSPLKVLAVAVAVTLGGIAGWMAVSAEKGTLFWLFVAWTFLWEIGGRNIPNDFNDIEEDRLIGIKTLPVIFGCTTAACVISFFLSATALVSLPMVWLATGSIMWTVIALMLAIYFLLLPGWRLLKDSVPQQSLKLYNRSCFYPPAMLLLLTLAFYL